MLIKNFSVRPVAPANQQIRLQTSVTVPGLSTVVQPNSAPTSTQPTVVTSPNPASAPANKILLPTTPVKVSTSEAKQIITSPAKVVTVTNKDGTGTQQFVLTNAIKQQSK